MQGIEVLGLGSVRIQRQDGEFGVQNPPRPGGRFRTPHKYHHRSRHWLGPAVEMQNGLCGKFGSGDSLRTRESDQDQRGPGFADPFSQLVGVTAPEEISRQLRDTVTGQEPLATHRRNKATTLRGGQVGHQNRP